MNMYCQSAFHQLEIVIASISEMVGQLSEEDLKLRPTPGKYSIGELLEHIASIPAADGHIAEGASKEEMERFYETISMSSKEEILDKLFEHFSQLKAQFENYTEEHLYTESTSWWGVTNKRYEWLLQIVAHMYHHRGQLHAMLVHTYKKDPEILLFE
ncbi:DinB family protein [Halobacillus litoralis]|uniref:Damage-inducible protein DinB n=1 Tax=Halobacillus litoralis TaxID=45668 RepID=A0A410MCW1_9BACI|nr:DinB family protein [Halobacillus litoralis]QAS52540.1 damage-inducible protein DinB [Halobacillus litoralis]